MHPSGSHPSTGYIGLGANIGDPIRQIGQALDLIATLPYTQLVRTASFYSSAPIGYTNQPRFVNTVTCIETQLDPASLFGFLLSIESQLGRERSFPNAPRRIDLDLLLYGRSTISTDTLQIPHPRMKERAFVLVPLLEIAPEVIIPGEGAACALLPLVVHQELVLLSSSF